MFLRGHDKYINNKNNVYKPQFEITMDSRKSPNTIDLMNRFKENIKEINESNSLFLYSTDDFKFSDEYNTLSYIKKLRKILQFQKENSKIIYRLDKITLLDYPVKTFLELINKLDNEKYNVYFECFKVYKKIFYLNLIKSFQTRNYTVLILLAT